MGVIQTIVANYSARYDATSTSHGKLAALLNATWRFLLPWAIAGALLFALLSGLIASFLNISTPYPVIVLGLSLIPIVLFPVILGALQGLQRFGRFGLGQITAASLRLVLGVGFILLGWGVSGALLGSVFAGLGAFLLGWYWLRDVRADHPKIESGETEKPDMRAEVSRFSLIVIFSMLGYMVLMNIDTIAVKSRFVPLEAGLYAAAATVGRVVLYVSTAVVTLMFPRVAAEQARGNPTSRIVLRALLVTVSLSILGVLVFSIRPELVMRLLFGQQFVGEAGLLVPYAAAMLLLAVVNVWMLYFLAVEEKLYTAFLLSGAALILAVLFFAPLSLRQVIWALTLCNAGLVLAGGWLLWRRNDG
jgi:O-antigen/teichoic acid export membrane protein